MVAKVEKDIEAEVKRRLVSLLSIVDEEAVVRLDKKTGSITVGGRRIDEARLLNLKSEAEFLLKSDIWKVIYETVKESAQESMFVKSESLADLQKGKSMLYTLSSQLNILNLFKSYQRKV